MPRPIPAKIMVVDDVPANLDLLRSALRERGYDVRCFPNGQLALVAVRREKPDLILLDMRMPGMSGLDVCAHIKGDANLRDIPVIFISALSEVQGKVHAFEVGGADYITKPFHMEEVFARVETHLELSWIERDLEERVRERTLDLEQANLALRDSEERFRATFEQAAVGLAHVTPDGRWLRVNKRFCEILERSPEALMALPLDDVIHPEDRERNHRQRRGLLAGELSSYAVEKRYLSGTGAVVWTNSTLSLVRDAQGGPDYCILAILDITEKKKTDTELQKTLDQLTRANAELERFAFVASHELLQPVVAVEGFSRILAQQYQGKIDAALDEYTTLIAEGATRMREMISDLRSFLTVDAANRRFKETDCTALVDAVLRDLSEVITDCGASVVVESLPKVMVDSSQMFTVFKHLIGNALKFRRSDRPSEIGIQAERANQEWLFSVRDNGIGIPPQDATRVFDVFLRLHSYHDHPGAGIGLSLCKRIIERHGGQIWVATSPAEGTTIHFTLPAQ